MANYKAHVTLGGITGYILSILFWIIKWTINPVIIVYIFLGTLMGSFLPDFDSDTSKPFNMIFSFFSLLGGLITLIYCINQKEISWKYWVFIPPIIFLFIRKVVSQIVKKLTIHRGFFHSIPAMFIATLLMLTILNLSTLSKKEILAISISVGIGYFTHLLLDEIYSAVNVEGMVIKPKKSFGTALTFVGFHIRETLIGYFLLFFLIYYNWGLINDFISIIKSYL